MNLLVRAFFAGEVSAINGVRSMFETLGSVMERLSPEYMIFALDGGHVERTRLFPDYKAHRPPKPPELVSQIELAEKALDALGWPAIRVVGWEADDVIASLAVQLQDIAVGTVVLSSDKDLLQIHGPAQIYHPWKGGEFFTSAKCVEKYGVKPSQMRDFLSLCGDKTDGIPGVTGIGEKTAAKLIAEYGTLDGVLAAAERGDVPGAIGKKLKEQAPAARLSCELVTLRTDLPVGSHWSEWPLHEPRAGWRDGLTALGLGTPAARLVPRLPDGPVKKRGPSSVDIEWCQIDSFGGDDNVESWYPDLASCPTDASLLDKVRAVYRGGLSHHEKGRMVANDWRQESAYFVAFNDGLNGVPLSVDLKNYDAAGHLIDATVRDCGMTEPEAARYREAVKEVPAPVKKPATLF